MTNAIDAAKLRRYKDHKPTQFDHNIALRGEQAEQDEWFIAPCSRTRDSDSLALSNWNAQMAALDAAMLRTYGTHESPVPCDREVHRFGHWGPGWYEIVLVRPGSECHKVAAELACALEGYPVLDDSDFSDREHETAWNGVRVGSVLRNAKGLNERTIDILFGMPEDIQYRALYETCDVEIYEDCPQVNADRMQLAKFLVSVRKQMRGAK